MVITSYSREGYKAGIGRGLLAGTILYMVCGFALGLGWTFLVSLSSWPFELVMLTAIPILIAVYRFRWHLELHRQAPVTEVRQDTDGDLVVVVDEGHYGKTIYHDLVVTYTVTSVTHYVVKRRYIVVYGACNCSWQRLLGEHSREDPYVKVPRCLDNEDRFIHLLDNYIANGGISQ